MSPCYGEGAFKDEFEAMLAVMYSISRVTHQRGLRERAWLNLTTNLFNMVRKQKK